MCVLALGDLNAEDRGPSPCVRPLRQPTALCPASPHLKQCGQSVTPCSRHRIHPQGLSSRQNRGLGPVEWIEDSVDLDLARDSTRLVKVSI